MNRAPKAFAKTERIGNPKNPCRKSTVLMQIETWGGLRRIGPPRGPLMMMVDVPVETRRPHGNYQGHSQTG